jgi:hypothetical protein
MNYWLVQLLSAFATGYGGQVLAARRSDDRDGGWMQILVFVILAIFYALGSIAKAKANKTTLKKGKQIPRKPPEGARELFKQPAEPTPRGQPRPQVQVQPPRRKVARPQLAIGRKPPKTEEAVGLATFEPLEVPKAAVPPKLEPKLGEIPEFTTKIERLKEKRAVMLAETPRAKYLSEILSDYDDPERLRRAILHYEILGKPISLRDPSEHII